MRGGAAAPFAEPELRLVAVAEGGDVLTCRERQLAVSGIPNDPDAGRVLVLAARHFAISWHLARARVMSHGSCYPRRWGATMRRNSRDVIAFVRFQKLGKWRVFPVTR